MTIESIMTKRPAHIGPEASVFAALNLLNELDVRHLPVVEAGELRGIISDRDLKYLSPAELDKASEAQSRLDLSEKLKKKVSEVMSTDLIYLNPESSIKEAIDLMLDQKVGAIPIVSVDNSLVGIVSYIDVIKAASNFFD